MKWELKLGSSMATRKHQSTGFHLRSCLLILLENTTLNTSWFKLWIYQLRLFNLFNRGFVLYLQTFDPGLVLYIYDSIPGYVLIAIKIASWLWFCYAIFFTLKHYPEKMSFYIPFFILYTIWWVVLVSDMRLLLCCEIILMLIIYWKSPNRTLNCPQENSKTLNGYSTHA